MPDPDSSTLKRITTGAVHTLGSTYAGRLVNWIAGIILMRQLTPEEFGNVAWAASLLALVIALRNPGLHNALLHHYDRVDDLAFTHFALNMGLSVAGALVAVGLAIFYVGESDRFGDDVALALSVFACFDLLRSAVQTTETQLRRDLAFSRLAGAHAAALVCAAAAGVAAAFAGAGIWALIISHAIHGCVYVTMYSIGLWARRPPQFIIGGRYDRVGAHSLLQYGRWFWAGGIMRTAQLHLDRLIVGTFLEAGLLGFYERAHAFAQLPTGAVTHALSSIGVAVYARYQTDRELLSGAFRRSLRLVMRATVPMTAVIAIEMPAITRLLVGDDWLPMVPVVRCLVLFSLCRPVLDTAQALLRSVGDPRGIFWFELTQALFLLATGPALIQRLGIEGMALVVGVMAAIGTVMALIRTGRYADVPALGTFGPALLAAAAATAVRMALAGALGELPTLAALPLGMAIFAIAYAAVLFAVERRALLNELATLRTLMEAGSEPAETD